MSTKIASKTKKPSKRVILDYSQNLDLDYVFSQLENVHFPGMSKSEITKLAVINLFKMEESASIPNLNSAQEASLKLAMADRDHFTMLNSDEDIHDFTQSLLE